MSQDTCLLYNKPMEEKIFAKALSNFTSAEAYGDAIYHLASKGMTVSEIEKNLTYPCKREVIMEKVWEYYLANEIVLFEGPAHKDYDEEVTFEKVYNGSKASFQKVVKKVPANNRFYEKWEYGILKHSNPDKYNEEIRGLSPRIKERIEDMTLPNTQIWVDHAFISK